MKANHFGLLDTGDDADPEFQTVEGKQKKEKPVRKTSQQEETKHKRVPNINANVPGDFKDDTKEHKHDREHRPVKGAYDHKLFDRQSANLKPHEARKQGGGAGNIGNMRDEMNQDKILAKVKEDGNDEVVDETPKVPEKPSLTLDQYYLQQGISLEGMEKQLSKEEKKKNAGPVEAEWIAKEKLTLIKTKEDNKDEEGDRKPAVLKTVGHKVAVAPEQELLGFKSGLAREERRAPREDNPKPVKSSKPEPRKGGKPVISEEDFPSL